jgi:hypothetical protein
MLLQDRRYPSVNGPLPRRQFDPLYIDAAIGRWESLTDFNNVPTSDCGHFCDLEEGADSAQNNRAIARSAIEGIVRDPP